MLWVEDDFRTFVRHPGETSCFCDAHLEPFGEATGETLDRQTLVSRLIQPGPPDPIRVLWFDYTVDLQGEFGIGHQELYWDVFGPDPSLWSSTGNCTPRSPTAKRSCWQRATAPRIRKPQRAWIVAASRIRESPPKAKQNGSPCRSWPPSVPKLINNQILDSIWLGRTSRRFFLSLGHRLSDSCVSDIVASYPMSRNPDIQIREQRGPYGAPDAVAPFKMEVWRRLSPAERLARSWRMRDRLPNIGAVHDRKLFPKP